MNYNDSFPSAINPPSESVVNIDSDLIGKAMEVSRISPRRRVILPFHKSSDDTLQRMLNALQPGSYVQPHRHKTPPKAESIIVLKGAICYITFKDNGDSDKKIILTANSAITGIDTEPGIYHTFFALEKDTVLFEVKPGPYSPDTDKDFATWAPSENADEAVEYLNKLYDLAKI